MSPAQAAGPATRRSGIGSHAHRYRWASGCCSRASWARSSCSWALRRWSGWPLSSGGSRRSHSCPRGQLRACNCSALRRPLEKPPHLSVISAKSLPSRRRGRVSRGGVFPSPSLNTYGIPGRVARNSTSVLFCPHGTDPGSSRLPRRRGASDHGARDNPRPIYAAVSDSDSASGIPGVSFPGKVSHPPD